MGLTNSTQREFKKYSDDDIKKNILNMCQGALSHNLNDKITESIKGFYNLDVVSDELPLDKTDQIHNNPVETVLQKLEAPVAEIIQPGGNIKFKSDKQRYLRHNINDYLANIQAGGNVGNDQYQDISDKSEFEKIRNYLMNDIMNTSNIPSPANASNKPQFGGNLFLNEDDDFPNFNSDIGNDTRPTLSRALLDIMKEEDVNKDTLDDEESEDPNMVIESDELSETSEMVNDVAHPQFSDTSYITGGDSSELHILPFYSSDTASNQHPYIKSRFNA